MKTGVLSGAAIAISALFVTPVHAQECGQIVAELNALSTVVTRDANLYWSQRKSYIDQKSTPAGTSAARLRAARLAIAAQSRAQGAKSTVPKNLADFAALAHTAQSLKCLPADQLKAKREQVFNLARGLNVDRIPAELATENGRVSAPQPRMPTR